jgi:ectoine hydroxylase-related dioxygenase (phytanoyl-CoA dioxygenase family)
MSDVTGTTVLDPDQLAAWRRDGFLVLRGALDAERTSQVQAWVDEITGWAAEDGPGLHHFEQTDAGPTLARSEDLIGHHDGVRALLTEGLLPELAGALFGEPAVLYKEKINYKQPGGGGFAPHQDAPAYRFVDHHISVMVPLDPATEDSGCLWVAPAFEPKVTLPMEGIRGLRDDVVEALEWQPVELQPGDLLWFDSYLPHRSDTNTTDTARRAFYLTYNSASAGDFRTSYYDDKLATFEGVEEGDRARLSITDDFLGRPVDAPS